MAISVRALPIAAIGWGIVTARIVLVIWVGTVAYADDQLVKRSVTPDMIGKLVTDREGNSLGKIQDVVLHWRSDGYAEYAVLSFGGFLGVGEAHVAVPKMNKAQLNEYPQLLVYRFYDRSFAAALGAGRSTADSSAHAMTDNIESAEPASAPRSFGRHHAMEQKFAR